MRDDLAPIVGLLNGLGLSLLFWFWVVCVFS